MQERSDKKLEHLKSYIAEIAMLEFIKDNNLIGNNEYKKLKNKIDELVAQIKNIDLEEVKDEFDKKVNEIKMELVDLDKEKVLEMAKQKGEQLKTKAQELVEMAVEKGTPILKKSAEDVLKNVIKVSKETIKKLDNKN